MEQLLKLVNTLGKILNNEIPVRQLSKESKVPNTTAHRLIKENSSIFSINKKGNIKLVSLNLSDPITKNYLILSERNAANEFLNKNSKFKLIKKELTQGNYTLILFGSRADGTHREKSDIDLCIINEDGKKKFDFKQFEMLYGIEVNSIYLKRDEFISMRKEKEHNLADEIIKKHIILYGEEYFWNMVWENGI